MSSKYNHNRFNDYKTIDVVNYATKKRGFLASLDSEYILDNDLLLIKLVQYYSDLNNILKRASSNYHDYMFMRFAFKTKMFFYEDRFENILELWDEAFSLALETYLKERHVKFIETYGISYVAYFDINFSNALYYSFINLEYKFNNSKEIPVELFSEIDNVNSYSIDEQPVYQEEFDLTLVSHSFAPSLLSIL